MQLGLYELGCLESFPILGIGVITACFHAEGSLPLDHIRLNNCNILSKDVMERCFYIA